MDDLTDLREACAAMERLDKRRANQLAYRDELIRKAIDAGATWVQVMEASGLSRRAIQQAIRRDRSR